MQRLDRLPPLARRKRRQVPPQMCERCEHASANGFTQRCLELDFPHERGEHRTDIRCLAPPGVLIAHLRLALKRPRIVVRSLRGACQSSDILRWRHPSVAVGNWNDLSDCQLSKRCEKRMIISIRRVDYHHDDTR